MLSGLAQLTVELTSRCDKTHLCAMCGHQNPAINPHPLGDMDYRLIEHIRAQVEPGITISLHRDGEPTSYPQLKEALDLFAGFTISMVTHGLNLRQRSADIIGRVSTCTISVFRGDPDNAAQLEAITGFLHCKQGSAPHVQIKIVGDMSKEELAPYEALGVRIIRRLIHVPLANSKYAHRSPTIPEVGICLDALHRPTIDWRGRMSLCNRLDPQSDLYLGDVNHESIDAIWNGPIRMKMIEAHKAGRRDLSNDLCKACTFWGVASD